MYVLEGTGRFLEGACQFESLLTSVGRTLNTMASIISLHKQWSFS